MQIIHWLFKDSSTGSRSRKEQCKEEEVKSRDLVAYEGRDDQVAEAKNTFTILLKREDSRASFYSTLQLKRPDSLRYYWRQKSWQVERGHKAEEAAAAVGCKVLHLATLGHADGGEGLDKEAQKRGRGRGASRMKELMKWAAAARSRKGGTKGSWKLKVLYFRNKMALKDPLDDTSESSGKIFSRWDVGSCSTSSSSVFLPMSMPMPMPSGSDKIWSNNLSGKRSTASSLGNPERECNKAGQWITSDSEFVVLEL